MMQSSAQTTRGAAALIFALAVVVVWGFQPPSGVVVVERRALTSSSIVVNSQRRRRRPQTSSPGRRRNNLVSVRRATELSPPPVDENEVKLGELIFSSRDPRVEVAMHPEAFDDAFCAYVSDKAEKTEDLEERLALRSLVEMVKTVRSQLEAAAEEARVEEQAAKQKLDAAQTQHDTKQPLSMSEVLRKAQEVSAPASAKAKDDAEAKAAEQAGRSEAGLSGSILATYEALLERLSEAYKAGKLEAEVMASYDQCDASLLTLATSRRDAAKGNGDGPEIAGAIVETVNKLAAQKLSAATARLQSVLRAGAPEKMFQKITELAVSGSLDRVTVELLEANRQQATNAGATDAAELMRRLAARCRDELDRTFTPEKKLLRALLRCGDDADARERLLRRAFEPKEELELGFDGRKTEGGVEVEPPVFIAACQTLINDCGNLQLDDDEKKTITLAARVLEIAAQAEAIAIEIFGDSVSPQEQQDRMWNDATTSVFDLEAAEYHAEARGERMPWQNDAYDDMLPPGFDAATGIKRVGGGG